LSPSPRQLYWAVCGLGKNPPWSGGIVPHIFSCGGAPLFGLGGFWGEVPSHGFGQTPRPILPPQVGPVVAPGGDTPSFSNFLRNVFFVCSGIYVFCPNTLTSPPNPSPPITIAKQPPFLPKNPPPPKNPPGPARGTIFLGQKIAPQLFFFSPLRPPSGPLISLSPQRPYFLLLFFFNFFFDILDLRSALRESNGWRFPLLLFSPSGPFG